MGFAAMMHQAPMDHQSNRSLKRKRARTAKKYSKNIGIKPNTMAPIQQQKPQPMKTQKAISRNYTSHKR